MLSGIYLFTQVLIALTMLSNWDGIQQQIYIFGLFPLVGMAYIGELIIIASDSGKNVNFSTLFTPIIQGEVSVGKIMVLQLIYLGLISLLFVYLWPIIFNRDSTRNKISMCYCFTKKFWVKSTDSLAISDDIEMTDSEDDGYD
jgi:hypothetical protein